MIRYRSTARDWWWNSHPASPERSCRAIQLKCSLNVKKPWRDQVLSVSHQTPSTTINNHEQQKNNHQSFYGKDEASQSKNQCNRLSIYHISVRTYSITPSSQAKSDLCLICGNTVGWGVSQKIDGTQVTVAIASPFPVIISIYIYNYNNKYFFYCYYSWYISISSTTSILLIIIDHYYHNYAWTQLWLFSLGMEPFLSGFEIKKPEALELMARRLWRYNGDDMRIFHGKKHLTNNLMFGADIWYIISLLTII